MSICYSKEEKLNQSANITAVLTLEKVETFLNCEENKDIVSLEAFQIISEEYIQKVYSAITKKPKLLTTGYCCSNAPDSFLLVERQTNAHQLKTDEQNNLGQEQDIKEKNNTHFSQEDTCLLETQDLIERKPTLRNDVLSQDSRDSVDDQDSGKRDKSENIVECENDDKSCTQSPSQELQPNDEDKSTDLCPVGYEENQTQEQNGMAIDMRKNDEKEEKERQVENRSQSSDKTMLDNNINSLQASSCIPCPLETQDFTERKPTLRNDVLSQDSRDSVDDQDSGKRDKSENIVECENDDKSCTQSPSQELQPNDEDKSTDLCPVGYEENQTQEQNGMAIDMRKNDEKEEKERQVENRSQSSDKTMLDNNINSLQASSCIPCPLETQDFTERKPTLRNDVLSQDSRDSVDDQDSGKRDKSENIVECENDDKNSTQSPSQELQPNDEDKSTDLCPVGLEENQTQEQNGMAIDMRKNDEKEEKERQVENRNQSSDKAIADLSHRRKELMKHVVDPLQDCNDLATLATEGINNGRRISQIGKTVNENNNSEISREGILNAPQRLVDERSDVPRIYNKKRTAISLHFEDSSNDGEETLPTLLIPTMKKKRRARSAYTLEETDAIKKGIRHFGWGNWAIIKQCYPVLSNRTNVDIKDKARNLKREIED
eukprot:CAMPEP_0184871574 /NCGR_PEP_ID=MMETSP0580-20130426/40798_1 /TAXON_ID=1118495 /ORGANISM="Dactyliosolen fragilissimus" /LENGTH=660 /DNA_ID=CAMNT_0027374251 /DNA_START=989 /DNA_END=2971 /DNA_ORIENTATION=-